MLTGLLDRLTMPFPIGTDVVVLSLGKTGRVVEAARNGRYRVRVGAVLLQCREEDLGESTGGDRRHRRRPPDAPQPPASPPGVDACLSPAEARRLASIDLHGFTVEEALSTLSRHLDLALRAGLESVEIIHGRSSGRIKLAVHRLLAETTAIRHFEITPNNPGVTRAYF